MSWSKQFTAGIRTNSLGQNLRQHLLDLFYSLGQHVPPTLSPTFPDSSPLSHSQRLRGVK